MAKYDEVMRFIEDNKRNLSKYNPEERTLVNWAKQQRKLANKGDLKPDREEKFRKLLELREKYKRKNQYA